MVELETGAEVGLLLACLTFVYWQPWQVKPGKMREAYDRMDSVYRKPPAWVFGAVWGVLFLLQALAYYFYFSDHEGDRYYVEQFVLFVVGGVAMKAWTPVFFGMRHYWAGALMAFFICLTFVVAVVLFFMQHLYLSGGLLVPHVLWTAYATFLAASVYE